MSFQRINFHQVLFIKTDVQEVISLIIYMENLFFHFQGNFVKSFRFVISPGKIASRQDSKMRGYGEKWVTKTTNKKVALDSDDFIRNNSNKEIPINLMGLTCIKEPQNLGKISIIFFDGVALEIHYRPQITVTTEGP